MLMTDALVSMTASLMSMAAALVSMTAALVSTEAALVSMTAAPVSMTAALVSMTAALMLMTDALMLMTDALMLMTDALMLMTAALVSMTAAPVSTTGVVMRKRGALPGFTLHRAAELAEKLGVGQARVSQWETDKAEPPPELVAKLEKLIGPEAQSPAAQPSGSTRRAGSLLSQRFPAVRRKGLEPLQELPHWNLNPQETAKTAVFRGDRAPLTPPSTTVQTPLAPSWPQPEGPPTRCNGSSLEPMARPRR
jgi:transcriptional regulator with XRE-family HTH domain